MRDGESYLFNPITVRYKEEEYYIKERKEVLLSKYTYVALDYIDYVGLEWRTD
jgi:hypothetical protein